MKKKILLLTLGICATSFAQKTWVTGTLPVKVEERTLFYNGGGFAVSSADAIVYNQGNIQVGGGDFSILNNTTKDNFFMDWQSKGIDSNVDGVNDDLGYGQLIINESVAVAADSKIALEKKTPSIADIDNAQLGLPFSTDDTGVSILSHSTNSTIVLTNSTNRLHHPLYKWNNELMRWDRKDVNSGVKHWEYYIIRDVTGTHDYNNASERIHLGTPNNVVEVPPFYDHSSLPDLRLTSSVNDYNEVYKSYIDEYFDQPSDPDWGKNQFQYGNPYTSNIDLSYIGFNEEAAGAYYDENGNGINDAGEALNDNNAIAGLIGIYKVVSGTEVNPVYGQAPNSYTELKATANGTGQFSAGDSDALLVKPMEAFVIKTDGTAGSFNFNDGLKTFSYSAKVLSNAAGSGAVSFRSGNSSFGDDYYQLRMNLTQGDQFINKTYVVAQSDLSNGIGGMLEAINVDLAKGIFTKEEVAEGEGVDPNYSDRKYYINQVNTDYLGIPIPLYIKSLTDGESYTIDFDLCLGIIDLPQDELSYANQDAKYYFHDIFMDQYFEVKNNSTYDFVKTSNDGTAVGNRFELFFGEMVEGLGVSDIDNAIASTSVYKNDGNAYVRFDQNWGSANIYVYTAVGQLVFMQEDVATDSDYLLPLNNSNITTYIIKLEDAETGDSVSKKVIK